MCACMRVLLCMCVCVCVYVYVYVVGNIVVVFYFIGEIYEKCE